MKTVIIPSNTYPWWECVINGVKYRYASGTEQSVPDEVAQLIADNAALEPQTAAPGKTGQVWMLGEDGFGHWTDLPQIKPGEPYQVLTVGADGALCWSAVTPNMVKPGADGKLLRSLGTGTNAHVEWNAARATLGNTGTVKMGASVADAADADDLVETLNALLASLRNAGTLAPLPASAGNSVSGGDA